MAQEFQIVTQRATSASAAMRNRSFTVWPAMALLLCVAQAPIARADPASCIEKVSSYVAELDQLLAKERNRITPFHDLNNRYFPFVDCDTDTLLEAVWRSRFIQPITYNPRAKEYLVLFSSKDVKVGFAYGTFEKESNTPFALWVDK
jgi:hypothetical protein